MRSLIYRFCACFLATLLFATAAHAGPVSPYYLTGPGLITVFQEDGLINKFGTKTEEEYGIAISEGLIRTTNVSEKGPGIIYTTKGDAITDVRTPIGGIYDGTTDGKFNYGVVFETGEVYRFNLEWNDPEFLFRTDGPAKGITYDAARETIWVGYHEEPLIIGYNLDGEAQAKISSPVNRIVALGWDPADGTLWYGFEEDAGGRSRTLLQMSIDGELLQKFTIDNVGEYQGGEFELVTQSQVPQLGPVDTSGANAGRTRIGTTSFASVGLENIGSGEIVGDLGSPGSGPFSGGTSFELNPDDPLTYNYRFTPTAHGSSSANVRLATNNGNPNGTNSPYSTNITLTGIGVGPEFAALNADDPQGGSLDLGMVDLIGGPNYVDTPFSIRNNSPDGDLGSLTDLTIHGFNITPQTAGNYAFELLDANGDPLPMGADALNLVLAAGEQEDFTLRFTADPGDGLGTFDGLLTFFTDQTAAFGANGDDFSFAISATTVPEPTTLAIWLVVFGGVLIRRKRRGRIGSTVV